jgi:hypothetical protein
MFDTAGHPIVVQELLMRRFPNGAMEMEVYTARFVRDGRAAGIAVRSASKVDSTGRKLADPISHAKELMTKDELARAKAMGVWAWLLPCRAGKRG